MWQWVWPAFSCSSLREALWWMMSRSRWRSVASRDTHVGWLCREPLISDSALVSTSSFSFSLNSSSSFPSSDDVGKDREGGDGGRGINFYPNKRKTGFSKFLVFYMSDGQVDCLPAWRQSQWLLNHLGPAVWLHPSPELQDPSLPPCTPSEAALYLNSASTYKHTHCTMKNQNCKLALYV